MIESILSDVRFALRALVRRPLFAAAAAASLGIGIAAVTVVLAVVNAALFKPLSGVERVERLVELHRSVGGEPTDVTYGVFRALRERREVLEELAAYALVSVSVATSGEPVVRAGMAVSDRYFPLLGTVPALGRTFAPDEAGFPRVAAVAVISHDVWQREFGAAEIFLGEVLPAVR
jgi:putative ABC transport system permease protein